jgi:hypothetical protein
VAIHDPVVRAEPTGAVSVASTAARLVGIPEETS